MAAFVDRVTRRFAIGAEERAFLERLQLHPVRVRRSRRIVHAGDRAEHAFVLMTGWAHLLFFYAALLVELFSMFIHQRDGWTAVAGLGFALSIIGAVLVLIAAWLHRPAVEVVR